MCEWYTADGSSRKEWERHYSTGTAILCLTKLWGRPSRFIVIERWEYRHMKHVKTRQIFMNVLLLHELKITWCPVSCWLTSRCWDTQTRLFYVNIIITIIIIVLAGWFSERLMSKCIFVHYYPVDTLAGPWSIDQWLSSFASDSKNLLLLWYILNIYADSKLIHCTSSSRKRRSCEITVWARNAF